MAEKMITANLMIDVEGKGDYRFEVNAAIEPEWRAQGFEMARQLVTGFAAIAAPELLRKGERAVEIVKALRPPENLEYPGQPGEKVNKTPGVRAVEFSPDGVHLAIEPGTDVREVSIHADGTLVIGGPSGLVLWPYRGGHPANVLDQRALNDANQYAVDRLRAKLAERADKGLDPMLDAELTAILDGDAADDEPMGMVEIDKRGMYGGEFQQITKRHHFNSMTPSACCVHCQASRRFALTSYDTRVCRSVDG